MSVTQTINAMDAKSYYRNNVPAQGRNSAASTDATAAKTASSQGAKGNKAADKDEFSFWDLVDIINPLQHIPVVNTIYRDLTGDKIGNFARIAGGTLFGGFAGAAVAGINAISVNETGNDLGELAMAKAGLREANPAPAYKQAKTDEHIPMVEVRPMPKVEREKMAAQVAATPDATLKDIIWDAPSLLQVAAKTPVAETKPVQVASADQTAKKAEKQVMPHVVRDVPKEAYEMPAAMPDAKSLNEIEPGNPESPMPQLVAETHQVPNTMMQALAKYQSMQRMGDATDTGAIRTASTQKFGKLEGSVRRY